MFFSIFLDEIVFGKIIKILARIQNQFEVDENSYKGQQTSNVDY